MVYNSMTGTSSHLRGPSLYRALSLLLIIFILFPFLTFINIDTDIQPYALVLSIVVFIIEKDRRLPIPIALLLIPLLFSLCLLAIYGISFHAMRSVANYASLFFISAASYFVLQKTDKKHIGRILAIVTYSWFAVGMIQHFIDYEFMRLFIPNMSLDIEGGRGVTSLATEPSFYGMFCVFFLLLNYVYNHGNIWLLLTTIFQVVFLARSIIAIVFLGILCLFYLAMYISFRRLAILFLIFGAIYYAISISLEYSDLRAFYIIKALVDDPSQLLEIDTSVNARVNHILFSMAGFFDSYSLPHGYDAFYEFVEQATAANTFNIEWLGALHENMKIMSGYGAAFFELGLIAILIPVSITMSIFRYFERDAKRAVLPAIFINVMLFSAVQLSLPIIGLLLASLSCYAENYHADCRNPAGIG